MRYTRHRGLAAIAGIPVHFGPLRRDDAGGTGAGGTDGGSAGGGSGNGGNDGNTGTDGQGGKDGQGDGTGSKPNIEGEYDKERGARAIAAAREAEKNAKAAAKAAQDKVAAVLKAAGLTPDGKQDPADQLAAAKAAADKAAQQARQSAVELAVYRNAGKAGADPDALLDSRGFLAAVAELDPEAADFADKVTAAIKDAVKANGKLAAAPAGPARQGHGHTGNSGGGQPTSSNLAAAVKRKLGG